MMRAAFMLGVRVLFPLAAMVTCLTTRTSGVTYPFRVVWNVEADNCTRFGVDVNVTKFGIAANRHDFDVGDVITIFYESHFGIYPYFLKDGQAVNGGVPQAVPLAAHLAKVTRDILTSIPNPHFPGLGVIDYEGWTPDWDFGYPHDHVHNASRDLVRQQHPKWPPAKVDSAARTDFNRAAREMLESTVGLARGLRPGGLWGLFGYPPCGNAITGPVPNSTDCLPTDIKLNNAQMWLFEASSALFPAGYLGSRDWPGNAGVVAARIREALRVRDLLRGRGRGRRPVLLYTRILYKYQHNVFYSKGDLERTIGAAWRMGLDGAVIWDSAQFQKNKTICTRLLDYVDTTLGPYVQGLLKADRVGDGARAGFRWEPAGVGNTMESGPGGQESDARKSGSA